MSIYKFVFYLITLRIRYEFHNAYNFRIYRFFLSYAA